MDARRVFSSALLICQFAGLNHPAISCAGDAGQAAAAGAAAARQVNVTISLPDSSDMGGRKAVVGSNPTISEAVAPKWNLKQSVAGGEKPSVAGRYALPVAPTSQSVSIASEIPVVGNTAGKHLPPGVAQNGQPTIANQAATSLNVIPPIAWEEYQSNRKSTTSPLPNGGPVVNVNWSTLEASTGEGRKRSDSRAVVRAIQPPKMDQVNVTVSMTPEVGRASVPPVSVPETEVGFVKQTVVPHPQVMAELEEIGRSSLPGRPQSSEPQAVASSEGSDSGETYVQELASLLKGNAPWIVAGDGIVDLAPHEPERETPAYMNDLYSLVPAQPEQQDFQQRGQHVEIGYAFGSESGSSAANDGDYYQIVPDAPCSALGGQTLAEKFQPLSAINLTGNSTAPPRGATSNESIVDRPENKACGYLEPNAPAHYYTPVNFSVCRPSRNTHPFRHNPLYFEDPNLERCGQGNGCLTNVRSAAHFYGAIAVLPYLTTEKHPNECVRALPDCPTCHKFPKKTYFPSWSWRAAAVQAGAVTGLIYVIP